MRDQIHVKVPPRAKKGEVIRLMAKLNHPMESGWRQRLDGQLVPKDLAGEFTCLFNGREFFRAELDSGIASDPYLSFFARVEESGVFRFVWTDAEGRTHVKEAGTVVV
jgi:sulfur-oxidizing protein SoxZ